MVKSYDGGIRWGIGGIFLALVAILWNVTGQEGGEFVLDGFDAVLFALSLLCMLIFALKPLFRKMDFFTDDWRKKSEEDEPL